MTTTKTHPCSHLRLVQLRGGKRGLRLRVKLLQVRRIPRVPPFPAAFHLPRLLGADSVAKGVDEAPEEGLSTTRSIRDYPSW